jgi:hypothetical protein
MMEKFPTPMTPQQIQKIMAALCLLGTSVYAQTWTSTAGGNWSNGANWSTTPDAPANDGTAAILFNSAPATLTSAVDTPYSIGGLTFGSSTGYWTISGSRLTLGAGGIINNGAPAGGGVIAIGNPLTIGASQTWDPGEQNGVNRTVSINGAITGSADKTITISGAQPATLYRKFVIGGNSAATYVGNWIVDTGGRLSVASSATASLGTGTVEVKPGGQLGGEGGSSAIANNVTLSGGTLGATGDGGGGNFNGGITIAADSFINLTRGSAGAALSAANTAASVITGSGNLTQYIDTGSTTKTTTIGNTGSTIPNTNTGTLIINAGIVQLQKADNVAAWGGNVTINSGGTLRFNDFRENQIADTATVTINTGGAWNLQHGITGNAANQQVHEKITALVVNSTGSAFINDYSTPDPVTAGPAVKARILLGSGTPGAGAAGIYLNTGGQLSGSGIVNKDTIVQGGVLSAGDNGVGTLTFSENLTLATDLAADSLRFTLDSVSDQVVVSAGKTLNIGAGLLGFDSFRFTPGSGFAAGTYTLIDTSAAIVGSLGVGLTGTVNGLNATLALSNDGQDVVLNVQAAPTNNYSSWANGFTAPVLAQTGANADPDADGVSNVIEYVLGTDPRVTSAGVPVATVTGGNLVFTFERSDASETPDIILRVEVSNNLSDWTTIPSYLVGATTAASDAGVVVVENGAANDTITVTLPMGADTKKFARLAATVTAP